jgi:hypothetical protein
MGGNFLTARQTLVGGNHQLVFQGRATEVVPAIKDLAAGGLRYDIEPAFAYLAADGSIIRDPELRPVPYVTEAELVSAPDESAN